MNNIWKIIGGIFLALIVLYAGYRVYHHYTWNKNVSKVVTAISSIPTPTSGPSATLTIFKTMNGKGGAYLADENGKTLYTYSKDTSGISNCSGQCIVAWPAFGPTTAPSPEALPTDVTVITRADGSLQYTYKGLPLYFFVSDKTAGVVTGDGVNGFVVAR